MINQEGRRSQILDAALHVMAEHGFHGASIKRIAQRAGLKSPALIYWYFKDKYALLEGIFERMSPFLSTVAEAEASSLDDPPDVVLPRIIAGFMRAIQQPRTGRLIRILMSEFAKHPAVANFFAERGPMLVLRFLERYFTRQVELGRLREHDPRAAARAFLGMLLVFALGRELFPGVGAGFPDPDAYARQVTEIFLRGLSAR
jgi:TetR/AcrR family transcriptional regulator